MELRRIEVRNIRSFEEAQLELTGGTTLLWGDVGAGKTSLLHAIEMALFGFAEVEAGYLIRHRAPTAEVALTLSDGPVELCFRRGFHRKLRRGRESFEPDEKRTGLSSDGATTRYSPTELRRRAIELLGFPDNPNPRAHSDLWRWAVYVPQERMRQILESSDDEARLATVRKALGLERYRVAADNAVRLARELRRASEERTRSAGRLDGSAEELHREREAEEAATRALARASTQAEERRQALATSTGLWESARDERARLDQSRRELAELEGRLASDRRAQSARAEELARLRAEQAELDRELARWSAEADTLVAASAAAEEAERRHAAAAVDWERAMPEVGAEALALAAIDAARERRAMLSRVGSAARAELALRVERLETARREAPARPIEPSPPRSLDELDRRLQEATQAAEAAAVSLDSSRRARQELEELLEKGRCSRCGQTVERGAFEGHRQEAERELREAAGASDRAVAARRSAAEARALREQFERVRIVWEAALAREKADSEAVERQRSEVEKASVEEGAADAALRRLEEGLPAARARSSAARERRERLTALTEERRRAEGRLAELRKAEATAQASQARRSLLAGQIEARRGEVELADRTIAAALDRGSTLRRTLEKSEGIEAELIERAAEREAAARRLEEALALRHADDGERLRARERAEAAERRVLERTLLLQQATELSEIADFLSGPFGEAMLLLEQRRLAHAKVEFDRSLAKFFAALLEDPAYFARSDRRFSPWVEIAGEPTPPEALSGGERTALALAYRLALAEVVRSVHRLRLSTLILDEPTDGFSPEQVQRMGELLQGLGLPQVILVSHEAVLGGVADRVVRVEKVDGISRLGASGTERPPGAEPAAPQSRTRPRPRADRSLSPSTESPRSLAP